MTRKLEEEFNLPHMEDMDAESSDPETIKAEIQTVEDALTNSEKINSALKEVRGMEEHDDEMDNIARQAIESYEQLMSLGMNMTDMAAGPVFNNAANMLKIALEAKDSKVSKKLKQVDMMLKKARIDQLEKKQGTSEDAGTAKTFDRNELLRIISQKDE
jgi:hypothetical protein